jgi:hypothetical protein
MRYVKRVVARLRAAEQRFLDRPVGRLDILMAVIVVISILMVMIYVRVTNAADATQDNTRGLRDLVTQNRTLAQQAKADAVRAQNLARQIQQQRYDSSYANCIDQNRRNVNTLGIFNKDIKMLPPAQRAQASGTIPLLDAAVPHRNCLQVAAHSLSVPGPPLPKPPKPLPIPPDVPGHP